MNTPAPVSGLSGLSGQPAAPPVELDPSRGPGMWKLKQSTTAQTALGTKLKPLPATLTHARLTANGASGVNGHNATRLAALARKARCGHMPSLRSLVERSVKETHRCQLSVTLWMN